MRPHQTSCSDFGEWQVSLAGSSRHFLSKGIAERRGTEDPHPSSWFDGGGPLLCPVASGRPVLVLPVNSHGFRGHGYRPGRPDSREWPSPAGGCVAGNPSGPIVVRYSLEALGCHPGGLSRTRCGLARFEVVVPWGRAVVGSSLEGASGHGRSPGGEDTRAKRPFRENRAAGNPSGDVGEIQHRTLAKPAPT